MIDKTESGTEVQKSTMAEIDIDNIIQQLLSVRDAPGRQVRSSQAKGSESTMFLLLGKGKTKEWTQYPWLQGNILESVPMACEDEV